MTWRRAWLASSSAPMSKHFRSLFSRRTCLRYSPTSCTAAAKRNCPENRHLLGASQVLFRRLSMDLRVKTLGANGAQRRPLMAARDGQFETPAWVGEILD